MGYKKRRGRRAYKRLTSGGSYPFYRGATGGGRPYFITIPESKPQEVQLPPQVLDYMKSVAAHGKGFGAAVREWAGPVSYLTTGMVGAASMVAPQATAKFFEGQRQKAEAGTEEAKADAEPAKQEAKKKKRKVAQQAKVEMQKEKKEEEFREKGQQLMDDAQTLRDIGSGVKDVVLGALPKGPHVRGASLEEVYEHVNRTMEEKPPTSWPFTVDAETQIDPAKVGRTVDFLERWTPRVVTAATGYVLARGRR